MQNEARNKIKVCVYVHRSESDAMRGAQAHMLEVYRTYSESVCVRRDKAVR